MLLTDPEDSGTGSQVEKYAAAHGVKVIDYDRLTLGGSRPYYVSFNNVTVGKVMGQGLAACVAAEHVAKPQVIVMRGDPTDNNATLFYQGYYNGVIAPLVKSGKWTVVAQPAGTWDPPTAATEFEQAFTAHKNANAALIPNDENGAPIITYLKSHGVKPNTFPTIGAGRDADRTAERAHRLPVRHGLQGRSTRRPRPPSRWPSTCAPARPRRPRWSTAPRWTPRRRRRSRRSC